jgi:hypothetical protein
MTTTRRRRNPPAKMSQTIRMSSGRVTRTTDVADNRPSQTQTPGALSIRALWLAMITVFSLMAGAAAGVIAGISTHNPYAGILVAGSTFGGTVLLLISMAKFLNAGS